MLPYDQRAKVLHQGKEQGEVALTTWPLGEPRAAGDGAEYDWQGEAEIEAAPLLLGKANRRLELIGDVRVFTVLAAYRHDFLPHVELRLREARNG